jgi:hypothetical protein
MGKLAFPPQGVGTPVLFLGQASRFAAPEGALEIFALAVCLKAYPDTNPGRRCLDALGGQPRAYPELVEGRLSPHASANPHFYFRESKSAATKLAKTTEITPFIVKKAALSFERSSGLTSECS